MKTPLALVLIALAAFALPSSAAAAQPREPEAAQGEWLAGDLHVHSCYSHDAYCPDTDEPIEYEPGDDPGNLQEELEDHASENGEDIYTYGVHVGDRFQEAALRGLDYSAITDHGDLRSLDDAGFGAAGVIGLPGYENSLDGHAQMLGATRIYNNGDSSASAANQLADDLRADGGVFQANHPGYRIESAFSGCDTQPLHWRYGFDVRPDTIEVWNPTSAIVEAERSREGILAALREGRTSISDAPPANGGAPLLLEADADTDGCRHGRRLRGRCGRRRSGGHPDARALGLAHGNRSGARPRQRGHAARGVAPGRRRGQLRGASHARLGPRHASCTRLGVRDGAGL